MSVKFLRVYIYVLMFYYGIQIMICSCYVCEILEGIHLCAATNLYSYWHTIICCDKLLYSHSHLHSHYIHITFTFTFVHMFTFALPCVATGVSHNCIFHMQQQMKLTVQLGVLEISRSMVIGFMIQLISLRVMIMILILAMYFTMWLQMTAF